MYLSTFNYVLFFISLTLALLTSNKSPLIPGDIWFADKLLIFWICFINTITTIIYDTRVRLETKLYIMYF